MAPTAKIVIKSGQCLFRRRLRNPFDWLVQMAVLLQLLSTRGARSPKVLFLAQQCSQPHKEETDVKCIQNGASRLFFDGYDFFLRGWGGMQVCRNLFWICPLHGWCIQDRSCQCSEKCTISPSKTDQSFAKRKPDIAVCKSCSPITKSAPNSGLSVEKGRGRRTM